MARDFIGVLIGPKGATVAGMRRDSRARIHIVKEPTQELQVVEVEGNEQQIEHCVDLMRGVVHKQDPKGRLEVPAAVIHRCTPRT